MTIDLRLLVQNAEGCGDQRRFARLKFIGSTNALKPRQNLLAQHLRTGLVSVLLDCPSAGNCG
jgi:hypothetical protein